MPDEELTDELTAAVDAIAHAIVQRRHLSFMYKDRWRRVMPLIFGRSREGKWRLRAIQIGGTSQSGKAGDDKQRIFDLTEMSEVKVHDTTFKVPRQFEPEDPLITQPEVVLEFDSKDLA